MVIFYNGQRVGVFANMTIAEFDAAEQKGQWLLEDDDAGTQNEGKIRSCHHQHERPGEKAHGRVGNAHTVIPQ